MTENFLKTCAENNITLNESKVQWLKQEVIFAGYLIKENGYQIDPKLNEALRCFPENITDLHFLAQLTKLATSRIKQQK